MNHREEGVEMDVAMHSEVFCQSEESRGPGKACECAAERTEQPEIAWAFGYSLKNGVGIKPSEAEGAGGKGRAQVSWVLGIWTCGDIPTGQDGCGMDIQKWLAGWGTLGNCGWNRAWAARRALKGQWVVCAVMWGAKMGKKQGHDGWSQEWDESCYEKLFDQSMKYMEWLQTR